MILKYVNDLPQNLMQNCGWLDPKILLTHSNELRNYFNDHLTTKLSEQNKTLRELDSIPSFIELLQDNEDNIKQEPPTIEEIKKVLKSMKNGKASTDEFPLDLFSSMLQTLWNS